VTPIPLIGAFESTYQPAFDVDVLETTGHTTWWREDIELLAACGVTECRYPVRWHRVEAAPGRFDWSDTDVVLGGLRDRGVVPIVDLLHHTSYPRWLGGFGDARFGDAYLRYVTAFAERYPWVEAYTLFNEPFTTFLLCGEAGIWPPYGRGLRGFAAIARNVLPALTAASRRLRGLLPHARHVHVETAERATGEGADGAAYAAWANDRRFLLTDLLTGRPVDRRRPFVADLLRVGGGELLDVAPGHVDVLGVDYYAHNQWHWTAAAVGTTVPPAPPPFSELLREYWERYRLPLVVGETNIRGGPSDRATWLKYTLEQCELAARAGIPVVGYCWFPFVDSCDWGSILCRSEGAVDPVGAVSLADDLERISTSMTGAYARAARGAPSWALPAYRLQQPVAAWLAGWLPHMAHWSWREPPGDELAGVVEPYEIELKVAARGV
jgi:beta-glucosidase